MRFTLSTAAASLLVLSLMGFARGAAAQSAKAAPTVDPNRLIGTYYVIARYPIRREKACLSNEMVLYALGDKPRSIQLVTTCQAANDNFISWNAQGKFNPHGDGRIKLSALWPFTTRYWVLDLAPDYSWALVGYPNHKYLWILSRSTTLAPDVMTQLKATAAAQGFNPSKLIQIPQR